MTGPGAAAQSALAALETAEELPLSPSDAELVGPGRHCGLPCAAAGLTPPRCDDAHHAAASHLQIASSAAAVAQAMGGIAVRDVGPVVLTLG